MIRRGEHIVVEINYPRNRKINGVYEGRVIQVGCYRTGYAFFKLDSCPHLSLPNSRKYARVIQKFH